MSKPIPNVDLGGKIKIIDDSGMLPRWKTIAQVLPASVVNAKRIALQYGYTSFWLVDDLGNKNFIS